MTDVPSLDRIAAIAAEAGEAILDIYRRDDVALSEKADGSPVTAADEAAEAVIVSALAALAPAWPVVAEEAVSAGRVPDVADRFVLVDPLDGTKEFLSRNGEFTVNIAFVEAGVPVAGVVHAPALGRLYAGRAGEGAFAADVANGAVGPFRPIAVRTPGPDGLVVVASRSHMTAETEAFLKRYEVASFASAGSSLKLCQVASGEADLYPRLGRTMEWDIAAGDAVLRAAGGGVFTLDGAPLPYGKRNQPHDSDFANPFFVAAGGFDPFAAGAATA